MASITRGEMVGGRIVLAVENLYALVPSSGAGAVGAAAVLGSRIVPGSAGLTFAGLSGGNVDLGVLLVSSDGTAPGDV